MRRLSIQFHKAPQVEPAQGNQVTRIGVTANPDGLRRGILAVSHAKTAGRYDPYRFGPFRPYGVSPHEEAPSEANQGDCCRCSMDQLSAAKDVQLGEFSEMGQPFRVETARTVGLQPTATARARKLLCLVRTPRRTSGGNGGGKLNLPTSQHQTVCAPRPDRARNLDPRIVRERRIHLPLLARGEECSIAAKRIGRPTDTDLDCLEGTP